jgi:hypothetical protein
MKNVSSSGCLQNLLTWCVWMILQELLFYVVPDGAMEVYRASVESDWATLEVVRQLCGILFLKVLYSCYASEFCSSTCPCYSINNLTLTCTFPKVSTEGCFPLFGLMVKICNTLYVPWLGLMAMGQVFESS